MDGDEEIALVAQACSGEKTAAREAWRLLYERYCDEIYALLPLEDPEESRVDLKKAHSVESALTTAALRDSDATVRKNADDALRRIRRKRAELEAKPPETEE